MNSSLEEEEVVGWVNVSEAASDKGRGDIIIAEASELL